MFGSKKKITASEACLSFSIYIREQTDLLYPKIISLSKRHGHEINNSVFSKDTLYVGMLVVCGLYAYQVFDRKTSDVLNDILTKTVSFEIDVKKSLSPNSLEAYNFFRYSYSQYEKEYLNSRGNGQIPAIPTMFALLIVLIDGSINPNKNVSDSRFAAMFYDFLEIVSPLIGTWKIYEKESRIVL